MQNNILKKQNTITKESLSKAICRETDLRLSDSHQYVDDIIDTLIEALKNNNIVKIRFFGSFKTRTKKARIGRNPKTKKESMIEARTVIQFRVASTLKNRINDNVKIIPYSITKKKKNNEVK